MSLLPYARLNDAVEAAKMATPIALGGFPAIAGDKRLFCQCLVTIESYGLNVALPDQPTAAPVLSVDTKEVFESLQKKLDVIRVAERDANDAGMPPWVLMLIQIVLAMIDEWLNP